MMVAAVLVALVVVDSFATGLLIGKVVRLQGVVSKQAELLQDLTEVCSSHDYDLAKTAEMLGGMGHE